MLCGSTHYQRFYFCTDMNKIRVVVTGLLARREKWRDGNTFQESWRSCEFAMYGIATKRKSLFEKYTVDYVLKETQKNLYMNFCNILFAQWIMTVIKCLLLWLWFGNTAFITKLRDKIKRTNHLHINYKEITQFLLIMWKNKCKQLISLK